MKTPLQVISDFGCPTNSVIFAIKHLGDNKDLSQQEYQKGIQNIVGLSELPEIESYYYSKVLFRYVIQETIKAYNSGIIPLMDQVYVVALHKTRLYIENNPWVEMSFNIEHGLTESEEDNGRVIQQGGKREITQRIFKEMKTANASRLDIIKSFMEETGMSKPGATTYFHALKKEYGFKEDTTQLSSGKRVENKQQLAERLYIEAIDKSKPSIIELFQQALHTSKLGAQTYYYSCKKSTLDSDR